MPSDRVLVCLPTYDEHDNLEPMVAAIGQLRSSSGLPLDLLVVDDNSPDGTGELADRLAAEHDWMSVLHRPSKQGLGRAYADAFGRALTRDYGYVVEMDCDFSHPLAVLPQLVAAARDGAGLALGSRYVEGGGTADWGIIRRAISSGGNLYARTLLGVGVRDLTGGFKCIRREVLEAIDLSTVAVNGYMFQIELTYRALLLGFSVVEVPIIFTDRVVGGSKMSHGIVLEAVQRVPALRLAALRGRLPRAAEAPLARPAGG